MDVHEPKVHEYRFHEHFKTFNEQFMNVNIPEKFLMSSS